MSIHVHLQHVTTYRYDRLINLGPQVIRLRPAPHCRTRVLSYSLKVEPEKHFLNWQQDPFANYLARAVFPDRTREFRVVVDLIAEMAVHNPFDFFLEPDVEHFPFTYASEWLTNLTPYMVKEETGPLFGMLLKSIKRERQQTVDFLVKVNSLLQSKIAYTVRLEPGVQTPEQTLELASGSCRDTGWLLVQLLRHLGFAARFVSGYLIQLKPDVKAVDGPTGADADFTDLHAWCEVYLPGAGWIGLDPTSGLLAGEGHIPIACTPVPSSAAPISGALDPCEVDFMHQMSAQRIFETPRVTKPYEDEQWGQVNQLGLAVDEELNRLDVRLTMGGEPTFVSAHDRDGAEWNTDALGPTKRGLGMALMQRLQKEYGSGGFLHVGQGKWYPGEQLPRWSLSAYWRNDGYPCWRNPLLVADEREVHAYTTADAHTFVHLLADKLGVRRQFIQPGYEDTFYFLWRERNLPVNVDPFDSKLDDEMERARLRRVFEHRLDEPVGFVLPLSRSGMQWRSAPWFFRDSRMYLIPGDSPMGYRLPLESLPWAARSDRSMPFERDPFDLKDTQLRTPSTEPVMQAKGAMSMRDLNSEKAQVPDDPVPERMKSHAGQIRTALCVEVRHPGRSSGPKHESSKTENGVLYVFMPPLTQLEDYLLLLQVIEATAEQLDMRIVLEGYPPPKDPRMTVLQVTPDPGVLEVNIHPAKNWGELVQHTEFLYRAAHESKLSTEKFMMDGRHVGTGGGNHIVLGASTPMDSPFLRRPDVLGSMLTFWHNHPSMSYLFSGLFIGPTSQSPRIDEARNDQVYELEIALQQLDEMMKREVHCPPWLVDRTLRNLLIDVTGNTHRAEFSIDKLYSPDGPTGRLGLLELRGVEMPPHARMSLVQQLLIRALVAWFWKTPYRQNSHHRLTRWGTQLHDRFMLPTFVWLDFLDVLAELKAAGFAFDASWFAPHAEFRFPLIGETTVRDIQLSLRTALEPWHVMGEEGGAGGTVRYVDSSVERLELKVSGFVDNRFSIAINGVVPTLQPTGTEGEYAIGVRYRAWQPPSALHPSIGVHAPLTIDVVDRWQSLSMGGCRYHVVHPGGRHYDSLPINAFEAESRRRARFFRKEHTPGPVHVEARQTQSEFPYTLDLRRQT